MFITVFTTASHLPLSWDRSIQSLPHATSWRSILILSSHLCFGLSSGLIPSGFSTQNLYTPLLPSRVLHAPPISFFDLITRISICVYVYYHTVWLKRLCASVGLRYRSQWQSQWMYSIYGYTKYWKWFPLTCDKNQVRYRLKFKNLIFETSRPTVWETLLRRATEALKRRRDGLQVTSGPKITRSRGSSVSTGTKLRAARPMNQASIPGTEKTHSSPLQHPGRFWGTSTYLQHNR